MVRLDSSEQHKLNRQVSGDCANAPKHLCADLDNSFWAKPQPVWCLFISALLDDSSILHFLTILVELFVLMIHESEFMNILTKCLILT